MTEKLHVKQVLNLTVKADDLVWKEKHEDYQQAPANDFHHPSTMVNTVTRVPLIFHPNHHNSKDREKEKVPQAHPQDSISFKPLPVRCLVKLIDPCMTNSVSIS